MINQCAGTCKFSIIHVHNHSCNMIEWSNLELGATLICILQRKHMPSDNVHQIRHKCKKRRDLNFSDDFSVLMLISGHHYFLSEPSSLRICGEDSHKNRWQDARNLVNVVTVTFLWPNCCSALCLAVISPATLHLLPPVISYLRRTKCSTLTTQSSEYPIHID